MISNAGQTLLMTRSAVGGRCLAEPMSISDLHPQPGSGAEPAGPAGVLAEVVGRVREVAEALWAAQPEEDLVAVVERVAELRSVLAAVEAGAVVEVEQRGLARQVLHHVGTAAWLDHAGGLRRGEGNGPWSAPRPSPGPWPRPAPPWSPARSHPSRST